MSEPQTPLGCGGQDPWGGRGSAGEGVRLLPLHDQAGNVVAHALVDADLAPALERWRWSLSDSGYAVRTVKVGGHQHKVRLHRVVMCCWIGDGLEIDHINRDRLDNRRSNLRYATRSENVLNQGRKTHCPRGHEFNPENTITRATGWRACRTCKNARRRAQRRLVSGQAA